MSDQLTPKEQALKIEGEALLKLVQQGNVSPILGSDGNPVAGEKPESPNEQTRITVHNPDPAVVKQELLKRRFERVEKSRQALLRLAGEKNKSGEVLYDLLDIMRGCHEMLLFCRMEMACHDGITDEIIEDADVIVKEGVYKGAQGFDLRALYVHFKTVLLPRLNDFIKNYQCARTKRRAQLEVIRKRVGSAGLFLPGRALHDCLGAAGSEPVRFMPGGTVGARTIIILHGPAEATQLAQDVIRFGIHMFNKVNCVMLDNITLNEAGTRPGVATTVPIMWWRDCARSDDTLYEVLETVIKLDVRLVVVRELGQLFCSGEKTVAERKSLALGRLYRWAVEHMVAVLVADESAAEGSYAPLPSIPVSIIDGNLCIGAEKYPVDNLTAAMAKGKYPACLLPVEGVQSE